MAGPSAIGFIHIGKTGGTALKYMLNRHIQRTGFSGLQLFKHDMTFPRLCVEHPGSQALFFVRDPVSRFVSGFNSRLRQGLPRFHVPWRPSEAVAFATFATPNQLAEALSADNPARRVAAASAMNAIRHVRDRLVRYLGPVALLNQTRGRILYIGDVATFERDIEAVKQLLHIDPDIGPPSDDVDAHRSPATLDRFLSDLAIRNLTAWYEADYAVYRWCQVYRESA